MGVGGGRRGAELNIARGSAGLYPARNADGRAAECIPYRQYSGGMDAKARVHRGTRGRGDVAGGGVGAAHEGLARGLSYSIVDHSALQCLMPSGSSSMT
jgi:hypothetical protein